MKIIYRKIAFFVIVHLVYYNLCFLLFISEIFYIFIYQLTLILYYSMTFLDTLIRPISEKKERDSKYARIIGAMFLLIPFILILAFYENKFIITRYFVIWDNLIFSYLGLLIFLFAGFITTMSRLQLGRFGGGLLVIEDDHKLITKGLYKHIRHPMYFGALVGSFGMGLVFRSAIVTILSVICYFLIYRGRMDEEERLLIAQFGEEYIVYMKRTKRLIPFFY